MSTLRVLQGVYRPTCRIPAFGCQEHKVQFPAILNVSGNAGLRAGAETSWKRNTVHAGLILCPPECHWKLWIAASAENTQSRVTRNMDVSVEMLDCGWSGDYYLMVKYHVPLNVSMVMLDCGWSWDYSERKRTVTQKAQFQSPVSLMKCPITAKAKTILDVWWVQPQKNMARATCTLANWKTHLNGIKEVLQHVQIHHSYSTIIGPGAI